MRTKFSEMRLFNDDSQRQDTSFILNGKEWGVSGTEREGERERERCGALVKKGCGMGHKLDCWSSIYEYLDMDFIKITLSLFQEFKWLISLGIVTFHSAAICQYTVFYRV
jgi:hypothetical protein